MIAEGRLKGKMNGGLNLPIRSSGPVRSLIVLRLLVLGIVAAAFTACEEPIAIDARTGLATDTVTDTGAEVAENSGAIEVVPLSPADAAVLAVLAGSGVVRDTVDVAW